MKPSQIRVFDGLRLTTDHVNHLQGAFASGCEDFRQILGLGKPQSGLEVSVQDDGSVTIQPGVAFDFQKNRLACDNPLQLPLNFGRQDQAKFVCLKYEQVEDGVVEGHPTMIWDSCSAVVRDSPPDPKENLVALAIIVRDAEGKLQVRRHGECAPPPIGVTGPIAAAPPKPPGGATVSAPAATAAPSDSQATAASAPAATPVVLPPPSTGIEPAPPPAPLLARQGIVQLASDPAAASYLRTVAAPALRGKMGSSPIGLSFTLAQADFVPGIRVSGFSVHCLLSGDLVFPTAGGAPPAQHHFECVAHGEAVPAGDSVSQFAASQSNMRPVPAAPGSLWQGSELASGSVGQFSFGLWSGAPDGSRPPFPADVLAGLQAVAQLAPAPTGFQLILKLLWSGTIAEQSLQGLETQDIGFTWQVLFGWKAIGYQI